MLSDLIGKNDYANLKENEIGISGEIGRWKLIMTVKNKLISRVQKKKKNGMSEYE